MPAAPASIAHLTSPHTQDRNRGDDPRIRPHISFVCRFDTGTRLWQPVEITTGLPKVFDLCHRFTVPHIPRSRSDAGAPLVAILLGHRTDRTFYLARALGLAGRIAS